MMISNLPDDLVEEILSRVPLTSTRAMRSTCKKWNALTKDQSFTDKHIRMNVVAVSGEREFLMIKNYKAYLIGVNLHLHDIENNNVDLSIKCKGKLISLDNLDDVVTVSHCNGLLLCSSPRNMDRRLVIWNPYCGKPKWIKLRTNYTTVDRFALGYDKSCGSHKILRLLSSKLSDYEIYHLSSDSWMVPSVTLNEWDMVYMQSCVSLKGNTYWCAKDKTSLSYYLLCFDFTRERFGPRLPLPFIREGSLHVVSEEKLAMLLQRTDTFEYEIWVTDKMEPDAVLWSKFLKLDKRPHIYLTRDLLIDDEKKVAVLFYKDWKKMMKSYCSEAYIIGEKGYVRRVDFGELPNSLHCPIGMLMISYVPSSVQIN
ncbi:PREDICTED: putative F-box protein At3g20705 [Camelina sativa]|uniref:F-box protein At3g20705 n=1 Tax=Camelina sativa TaxID=90675 RepID=A0ABM0WAY6_CAMSA|nr:PREDICTED: putative F-box protein At3g20705 [Camelina sativa]